MTRTLSDGQVVKVERSGLWWKWTVKSPGGEVLRSHSGYPTEHAAMKGVGLAVEGFIPGYGGRAER